jgi:hypothetical protein
MFLAVLVFHMKGITYLSCNIRPCTGRQFLAGTYCKSSNTFRVSVRILEMAINWGRLSLARAIRFLLSFELHMIPEKLRLFGSECPLFAARHSSHESAWNPDAVCRSGKRPPVGCRNSWRPLCFVAQRQSPASCRGTGLGDPAAGVLRVHGLARGIRGSNEGSPRFVRDVAVWKEKRAAA